MDHGKLFKVLVIGGAMLGMGCLEESPSPLADSGTALPDASMPSDASVVAPGDDAAIGVDAGGDSDAGELIVCGICPNEECCETDEMGNAATRAGMLCCWGTSC